jgi:hypothetical protein
MLYSIETCKIKNVQDRNAVVHVHQFINLILILSIRLFVLHLPLFSIRLPSACLSSPLSVWVRFCATQMKGTVALAKTEDGTTASPHSMMAEEAKADDSFLVVRNESGEGAEI